MEEKNEINIEEINAKYKLYRTGATSAISMLLGEYDVNGKYYLPKEIATELVVAEKTIIVSNENVYDVYLNSENFNINLLLSIRSIGENNVATLELVEKLQSVEESYVKKLLTFVAVYQDANDEYFFNKACKAFHLHPIGEVGAKDILAEHCDNIFAKIKKRRAEISALQEDYNGEYKIYIATLLNILENSGEQGRDIIFKLRKLLAENAVRFSKESSDYYFKFKTLLEQVMENEHFELSQEQQKQLAPLIAKVMERKKPELTAEAPKQEIKKTPPPAKKNSKSSASKPFAFKEKWNTVKPTDIKVDNYVVPTRPQSTYKPKPKAPATPQKKSESRVSFDFAELTNLANSLTDASRVAIDIEKLKKNSNTLDNPIL